MSGEGTGSSKKVHDGKEYDYVFDIDIEDGKPPLKLPYNLTESAWDAARRFLERNELPFSYYEQVANWISDNTKGARLGPDSGSATQPQTQARDPWGTDRRYRPGDVGPGSTSGQRKIPQRSYVSISEGNALNAVNKILESSKQLASENKIPQTAAISDEEGTALKSLAEQITKNSKDPHPTAQQISALSKAVGHWPRQSRVPAAALLARLAVSPSFVTNTSSGQDTIVSSLASTGLLQPSQETANNVVHALRLLLNLFASDNGRLITDGTFDEVLKLARPFASQPESPAQFKALATLYLNYSVLLTSNAPPDEAKRREARARVLLIDIATMMECESPHAADADTLYRTLCALGTLLTLGGDFRAEMKSGVSGTLHVLNTKAGAQSQEVKEVVQEIRDELR